MTALRRISTPKGAPLQNLDLPAICDKCGRSRNKGNHDKCSKLRQAENRHLRK